ncbi:MAG: 16S rRNA processing protein RimM [Candidatus Cloacimonas sp. 4484_140]|nr:MAG: 16S rRNA processing protein RimM [Candidatus Cloacimonas sp. 4484_140]HHI87935.1 16S rRNA processing protein RimM [Candidatus Cloacimonadota bacterium]
MEINDLISIGVIKKVIGNGGVVSAIPDTSFPEYYLTIPELFIVFPDETVRFEAIDTIELKNGKYLIKFMNINLKDEARQMINAHIMIAEDMLPPLEEDEYYPVQFIEYEVITKEGEVIGNVADILSTAGQEILIIPNGDKEIMIPICDFFIEKVDKENKKIIINPIEGLLDAH